ncbi:MAG: alpha/beta hydrolase [Opitutales bacterium]
MNRFYRYLISTVFLLRALVSPLQVFAGDDDVRETVLTLANDMIATHAEPPDAEDLQPAAVLMIHGFASQMNEVGDMYLRLAEELAEEGVPSLRINIRGESEREKTGFRITSTFASRITDAETGLAFLRETYPDAQIGVVGFSLGGSTAMALAGRQPEAIDSLVLWSTAGNPGSVVRNPEQAAAYRKALDEGEAVLKEWVDLTITREHIIGMLGYSVIEPLSAYTGALLSIRGTGDFVPRHEDAILAAASASPAEFRIIDGADHIFQAFDPDSTYDDRVIDATEDWLEDTLGFDG